MNREKRTHGNNIKTYNTLLSQDAMSFNEPDSLPSHPFFGSSSARSHLLEREHSRRKASKVYDSLSNTTQLSLRPEPKTQARLFDSLHKRLHGRLRNDNSALRQIGQSERDVDLLETTIWNTLQTQACELEDGTIQ